jgi:hypothetical protein
MTGTPRLELGGLRDPDFVCRGLAPIEQTAQFGNDLGRIIFLPKSNNPARRGALTIVTRIHRKRNRQPAVLRRVKAKRVAPDPTLEWWRQSSPSESCTSGRLAEKNVLVSGATPSSLTGLRRRRRAAARRRRGGPPEGRRTISAGRFRCRAAHTASSRVRPDADAGAKIL